MTEENIENENNFLEYSFEMSIRNTEIILNQLKNSVCKIYNQKETGSGFFCKIPSDNKFTEINALITCNHVLGENDLIKGKKITLSFYDEKNLYSIVLDNNRIFWTNIEYDITIIEVKTKDQINCQYLNIHENLFSKADINSLFIKKPIYVLHNPNNNTLVSYGNLLEIDEKTINHFCPTKKGSSGGPILSLLNNKVIGIHKGYGKLEGDFNKGILLSFGINEFIKYLNSSKNTQLFNDLYTKINEDNEKFSHISKEKILEEDSFKDNDLNSTMMEQNSKKYNIINIYKIKEGEEISLNNCDEKDKNRKSCGNIFTKDKEKRSHSHKNIESNNILEKKII